MPRYAWIARARRSRDSDGSSDHASPSRGSGSTATAFRVRVSRGVRSATIARARRSAGSASSAARLVLLRRHRPQPRPLARLDARRVRAEEDRAGSDAILEHGVVQRQVMALDAPAPAPLAGRAVDADEVRPRVLTQLVLEADDRARLGRAWASGARLQQRLGRAARLGRHVAEGDALAVGAEARREPVPVGAPRIIPVEPRARIIGGRAQIGGGGIGERGRIGRGAHRARHGGSERGQGDEMASGQDGHRIPPRWAAGR